jgi:hypothetical protein
VCVPPRQDGNGLIPIWDMKDRSVTKLETSLKDPTFMKWSRSGPQLVIGTVKGNVLIYNKQSRKKVRGPTAHTPSIPRVSLFASSARRCRPCRPCDVARVTAAPARRPAPAATSRPIEPGRRDAAGDGGGADRPVATARGGCGRGAKATRTERQRRA